MKLVLSKLAAIAAASFALVCASACSGDKEPVQDVTFLTFGPASGQTLALGFSADRGMHFAHIDASSVLHMARSQAGETGGGGAGFFSGSISGASSFSGSTGGSTSFNGGTGSSASFSGSVGGSTTFNGTAIINGAACDLSVICDIVADICSDPEADCGGITEAQCQAGINSAEFQTGLAEAFAGSEELAAVFCAVIDFIGCLYDSAGSLDAIDDAAAQQCAQDAGLVDLFSPAASGI